MTCLLLLIQFLLLTCTRSFVATSSAEGEYFILRNPASGLVLDANEDFVYIQNFTGFSSQQWRLDPARDGKFYFVNKSTGRVLDIENVEATNTRITMSPRIDNNYCPVKSSINVAACQKWHVHHGSYIVNACSKIALDINGFKYVAGNELKTWTFNELPNQKFIFQYV